MFVVVWLNQKDYEPFGFAANRSGIGHKAVWYGAAWYGVVWYGAVWYGVDYSETRLLRALDVCAGFGSTVGCGAAAAVFFS